jgi:outer membrane protein
MTNNCETIPQHGKTFALVDAVRAALCYDPRTRVAWADVDETRAAVGSQVAAYFPEVNGDASVARVSQYVNYTNYAGANSSLNTRSDDVGATLSWVLYDFGLRKANLASARHSLDAAIATRDSVFQSVFLDAARTYFDVQLAQIAIESSIETERAANRTLEIANSKWAVGAAPLSDKVEAQTALARAVLGRVRAENDFKKTLGTLAIRIGFRPNDISDVSKIVESDIESMAYRGAVDTLIDQAVAQSPDLLAAQAQLASARSRVDAVKALGKPTISLVASIDRSNTPISEVTTEQTIHNRSIGLQISIPLFDGFSTKYQLREAEAQVEKRQGELDEVKRKVSLDVWESSEDFFDGISTVKASMSFLDSARKSLILAQGRYQEGIGDIQELLTAQSELANAQQQHGRAVTLWESARLRLQASLGRLSLKQVTH